MNNVFLHIIKPDMLPVGYIYVNIEDLHNYENDTIDNIIIQDLLDYVEAKDAGNLLDIIYAKLSPNGQLHIQSTDLKQLSIAIAFHDIELSLAQQILYPHKRSISVLSEITKLLIAHKYNVITSYYTNVFEYYITLTKNV